MSNPPVKSRALTPRTKRRVDTRETEAAGERARFHKDTPTKKPKPKLDEGGSRSTERDSKNPLLLTKEKKNQKKKRDKKKRKDDDRQIEAIARDLKPPPPAGTTPSSHNVDVARRLPSTVQRSGLLGVSQTSGVLIRAPAASSGNYVLSEKGAGVHDLQFIGKKDDLLNWLKSNPQKAIENQSEKLPGIYMSVKKGASTGQLRSLDPVASGMKALAKSIDRIADAANPASAVSSMTEGLTTAATLGKKALDGYSEATSEMAKDLDKAFQGEEKPLYSDFTTPPMFTKEGMKARAGSLLNKAHNYASEKVPFLPKPRPPPESDLWTVTFSKDDMDAQHLGDGSVAFETIAQALESRI